MTEREIANSRWSLACTTKEITEDLVFWVKWHDQLGCDFIQVFIDDSEENSSTELARRAVAAGATLTYCDPEYWRDQLSTTKSEIHIYKRQVHNARVAANRAFVRELNWLIHLDDDEYLDHIPEKCSVGDELASQSTDTRVLLFPVAELSSGNVVGESHSSLLTQETTLWKLRGVEKPFHCQSTTDRIQLALERRILAIVGRLSPGSRPNPFRLFNGHWNGKSAVRLMSPQTLIGLHTPDDVLPSTLQVSSRRLLHMFRPNFRSWKSKAEWRLAGNLDEPHYSFEDQAFKRAAQAGDPALRELYEKLYGCHGVLRIFLNTGRFLTEKRPRALSSLGESRSD